MARAAGPKKSLFTAGVFDNLEAAAGGPSAAPRLLLADIDEDPDQPRKSFDQGELEQLAETIKLLGGVLQPIGVRAPVDGRYMLVFGARRVRASRLLGLADIPHVIVGEEQAGLAAQVIENQSRADLSNSDLALAVDRLGAQGMKGRQIATICGLTEHAVTMFRSVARLPAFLSERMNSGDMRGIYELFTAWQKHPAEIEEAMDGHDVPLSVTEARRIIEGATGKATSSIYLKPRAEPAATVPAPLGPAAGIATPEVVGEPDPELPGIEDKAEPSAPAAHAPKAPVKQAPALPAAPRPLPLVGVPVFIMETIDGRRGVLVTDRRAATKGHALLDMQGDEIEAAFVELRPVNAD